MFQNIGFSELIIILAILVLIFGANRLPQIGEGIGKAIKNLKRGLNSDDDIQVTSKERRVNEDSSAKSAKEEISEADITTKR